MTSDPRDSIDRVLAGWAVSRPELDVEPIGVVARIGRLHALLTQELDLVFARYALTAPGFAVLATLVRLGEPHEMSQRQLMDELGLTAGTVSVRIDRLVGAGLVERAPQRPDRRGTLVVLTRAGLSAFEACAPEHLANERRLLAALGDDERAQLAGLLRKLLVGFEGAVLGEEPARLGLALAPAHVAAEMRRAVGLPDRPGLLVREVDDDGPAARAGLRRGDLLVRAGRRDLRSLADLYAALGRTPRRLALTMVRGTDERRVTLQPG